MPNSKEDKGGDLADMAVVHEFQPLIDVGSDPSVGVDVEGLDYVTKPGKSNLENS